MGLYNREPKNETKIIIEGVFVFRNNIVCRQRPQVAQSGFSISGYLASIVVAGVVTTSSLPVIHEFVDTADYSALSYARSTLINVMQVNHQMSQLRGYKVVVIDGVEVPHRFGYPMASAESLRGFAYFDGFDMDEQQGSVRIWSPGRLYCLTYVEANASVGVGSQPIVSRVLAEADGACI